MVQGILLIKSSVNETISYHSSVVTDIVIWIKAGTKDIKVEKNVWD